MSYVILDYGENVGGLPFFDIDQVTGNSSLRVSYSEALPNVVDGDMEFYPLIRSFDPYRVKSYDIINRGHIESPLIQGAQRYQRLALTDGGSIRISKLGIKSTHYTKEISSAPGSFSCSSVLYTDMWRMGARTLQINMIPPRITPPGFLATNQGFFLTANQAGVYLRGMQWVNYTVIFSTMIMSGGTSFALRSNDYSEILITINSKEHFNPNTLVVNTRQELPPPDSYIYNATLPLNISLLTWYDIKAIVQGLTIELSINGATTFTIPIPESSSPYVPSITPGGIAFTTSNSQETFFRDLQVIDISPDNFGVILYQDSLTSQQAVSDFGVGTNELPVILDGAKRDRNVWSGDILVAGPVLYYSFYEPEYAAGSLAILNSYQLMNGPVSSRINVGFPLQQSNPSDEFVSPIFYSYTYFLANIISVAEYYLYTGDIQFVHNQWPRMQLLMNFFSKLVDTDNLVVTSYPVWGYDYNPSYGTYNGKFTKLNILYAMALDNAASLADAISNVTAANQYRRQAAAIRTAVNTYLYNSTANFYMISDQQTVGLAQDTNSLAILSGIASDLNSNVPQQLLEQMKQKLRVSVASGSGYLSITSDGIPASSSVIVSPFISFFHAAAAFEQDRSDLAFDVLESVWSPMVQPGPYFTGTFWESERPSGYPGASTSMAHTWSAGITAILSKYVLGIKPLSAGYTTWSIRPQPGNLTWVAGTVCTPYGIMSVGWNNSNIEFRIVVNIPRSTSGVVYVPTQNNCIIVNGNRLSVTFYDNSVHGVDKIARNGSYLGVYIVSPGSYSIISNFTCNAVSALFFRSFTLICLILYPFLISLELSL
ncbi:unnamed protein product [Adineta steineri]|uniref:Alpha-L-rhamnosidase n=1 Tax=Adineta steineri TaxID=433720 RepID=A0A816BJN5_9BILA|nr:unnamed protein product [Adineta steineri]CAF1610760.1 unnamed protein product [Adineta steineri]